MPIESSGDTVRGSFEGTYFGASKPDRVTDLRVRLNFLEWEIEARSRGGGVHDSGATVFDSRMKVQYLKKDDCVNTRKTVTDDIELKNC